MPTPSFINISKLMACILLCIVAVAVITFAIKSYVSDKDPTYGPANLATNSYYEISLPKKLKMIFDFLKFWPRCEPDLDYYQFCGLFVRNLFAYMALAYGTFIYYKQYLKHKQSEEIPWTPNSFLLPVFALIMVLGIGLGDSYYSVHTRLNSHMPSALIQFSVLIMPHGLLEAFAIIGGSYYFFTVPLVIVRQNIKKSSVIISHMDLGIIFFKKSFYIISLILLISSYIETRHIQLIDIMMKNPKQTQLQRFFDFRWSFVK